jgi:hypothetical protein
MTDTHTPLPWRISQERNRTIIFGGTGRGAQWVAIIATTDDPDTDAANAAFIVRAVNSHAALLAACQLALEVVENEWGLGHTAQVLQAAIARATAPD